ncbi:MAG: response regulator transcription factor [Chloroflexota bacterium]|nr:response regulator transcription factor [Chloroflexota bacterium]
MADTINVLLADDHPLIRRGMRATFMAEPDITVVAEAVNGDQTIQLCHAHQPDILLLDLNMPGPGPAAVIEQLRATQPQTKILVLTAYEGDAYVRGLVEAGVAGYLLKEEAPETVVEAIRSALQGGTWFSRPIVDKMFQHPANGSAAPDIFALTNRERQVLELIGLGWDNARIAAELHLAEQTIRNYATRIYDKLNLSSRPEAIVWAREHGLIDAPP